LLALATMPDANDGDVPAALRAASSVPWKQARFYHGVERVRDMCGVPKGDRGDDAVIGMMLDRFGWDYERTAEMYQVSVRRRKELGMAAIKDDIVSQQLSVEDFPHHRDVMPVIPVFASTSLEPPTAAAAAAAEPGSLPVIGCYELRYGQGDPDRRESSLVTPSDFTRYMLYVTQWRWLQCERYAQRHGEIGLWSMVHDLSCPSGFFSLWSRARSVFNKYLSPVEEACGGLFPPMVQKILIVNVPSLFSPVWSVIAAFLPAQHKERIVMLTASKTTAAEMSKYMPAEHLPPHVRGR